MQSRRRPLPFFDVETRAIRRAYTDFFVERGHVVIPTASLVPREDPTTLFTGSGMQPLIPYLLGADHPSGGRLTDSQPCFRADDIDEVGDNRHTTFFEMLGSWSLGSYWKGEQLPWLFEFLIDVLRLDPRRIYVTVFGGASEYGIPRDQMSTELWTALFTGVGIPADVVEIGSAVDGAERGLEGGRIFFYDATKNWWTRAGLPEAMPPGEPGGPDSEVFYEFPGVEHDPAFGRRCHVHCDCGRFLEIGNSVFMEYVRTADGFAPLPRQNVDFGGGLERIAMAAADTPDIFKIDLLWPLIEQVASRSGASYEDHPAPMRVIADHARAAVLLASHGIGPSNTAQGYVVRRLMRRALRQGLLLGIEHDLFPPLVDLVCTNYADVGLDTELDRISPILEREEKTFRQTLARGTREFPKLAGSRLTGSAVFTLFDSYGFPPELSLEEADRAGIAVDPDWETNYQADMAAQRERSRSATAGVFKGGLADHSEETTKLHTATHLLYKALRLVLGDHVVQRGSNVTAERLRFDFTHPQKVAAEELAKVEGIVNDAIAHDWPVGYREIPTDQAFAEGAIGAFGDKYGPVVKVYTAGDPEGEWYSKEICGGPHVTSTGAVGRFRILKEEASSSGVRRIRAAVDSPASSGS